MARMIGRFFFINVNGCRKVMIKIVAVVGPTASGKSRLALEIAKRYGGEIVSCDSMQLYRGMDIGTAKPNLAERGQVPHHMLDIICPNEEYSCSDYARDAAEIISQIESRGNLPLICGGTGLYLDALVRGTGTGEMTIDPEFRSEMEQTAMMPEGKDILHRLLSEKDPAAAETIHKNNVKRVIRALEINHATGLTKEEWDRRSVSQEPSLQALEIGLCFHDRSILYRMIESRVDGMIRDGLVDEVRDLLKDDGFSEYKTASQAIGYKELIPYLRGECSLDEAADAVKTATRQYAKRQMTWFSRNRDIKWLFRDSEDGTLIPFEETVSSACRIVDGFLA